DGVVIGLVGFHVTMRIATAARFIVELIVGNATVRGGTKGRYEVLQPALLQCDGVINVIGVNIVVDELNASGGDAVAAVVAVRMHIGVRGLLRAIHRNRETAVPRR